MKILKFLLKGLVILVIGSVLFFAVVKYQLNSKVEDLETQLRTRPVQEVVTQDLDFLSFDMGECLVIWKSQGRSLYVVNDSGRTPVKNLHAEINSRLSDESCRRISILVHAGALPMKSSVRFQVDERGHLVGEFNKHTYD